MRRVLARLKVLHSTVVKFFNLPSNVLPNEPSPNTYVHIEIHRFIHMYVHSYVHTLWEIRNTEIHNAPLTYTLCIDVFPEIILHAFHIYFFKSRIHFGLVRVVVEVLTTSKCDRDPNSVLCITVQYSTV
jgi:hypothetical protein